MTFISPIQTVVTRIHCVWMKVLHPLGEVGSQPSGRGRDPSRSRKASHHGPRDEIAQRVEGHRPASTEAHDDQGRRGGVCTIRVALWADARSKFPATMSEAGRRPPGRFLAARVEEGAHGASHEAENDEKL